MFGTDKNFKLPKTIKRLMTSLGGKKRIEFKHAMIRAIATAVKAPPPRRDKNQKHDKE
jgi:hypothetical protein